MAMKYIHLDRNTKKQKENLRKTDWKSKKEVDGSDEAQRQKNTS